MSWHMHRTVPIVVWNAYLICNKTRFVVGVEEVEMQSD
jgi:hypothetical protein